MRRMVLTKSRWPYCPIAQKRFWRKNQAIFTDICWVQKSPDFDPPGRAAGHFWPSRLGSCILFNSIEGKRQGVCFGNKNKVSWPYFSFFTGCVTKYSPYFFNQLGSLLDGRGVALEEAWFQRQALPYHPSQISCKHATINWRRDMLYKTQQSTS